MARCCAIAKGMAVEMVDSAKLISTEVVRRSAVGKIDATVKRIVRPCLILARDFTFDRLLVEPILAMERLAGNWKRHPK